MRYSFFTISLISFACSSAFAATPVDLSSKPALFFSSINAANNLKETSRHVDFNKTTHIRFQQTYANHPVWGADGIAHVPSDGKAVLNHLSPSATMNGTYYLDLAKDLEATPSFALNPTQAKKALKAAIQLYQTKHSLVKYDEEQAQTTLIVYVDKQNKAHWAYLVSFVANPKNASLELPTYILDATTFAVYEHWNNLQTSEEEVSGGGFGGNQKIGKITYDGTAHNYPILNMQRKGNVCTLQNDDVLVKDDTNASGPFSRSPVAKFTCKTTDPQHQNLYWDGDKDAINGGFSPVNDSLYIGKVVNDMYQNWYHVPVLTFLYMPIQLVLHAHAKDLWGQPMDNAFFFPLTRQMYFGDGVKYFYPLTSIGVGAHELSHGFTSLHSNLSYQYQSGGLNESYSDMAAQAGEFYSTGKNSWQIGPEIVKGQGALRYMDDPTKDGKSIAHIKDYNDGLNVHYSSGIFNKVFYTLGTTEGWDTKKAFDVMVKANMDYWTSDSTFAQAACGVLKATQDYKYDTVAVAHAMAVVGLSVSNCK